MQIITSSVFLVFCCFMNKMVATSKNSDFFHAVFKLTEIVKRHQLWHSWSICHLLEIVFVIKCTLEKQRRSCKCVSDHLLSWIEQSEWNLFQMCLGCIYTVFLWIISIQIQSWYSSSMKQMSILSNISLKTKSVENSCNLINQ